MITSFLGQSGAQSCMNNGTQGQCQAGFQIIWSIILTFFGYLNIKRNNNALCNKSNGRCDIKAEKREELESKSSHKSDIWLPAASKKWGEIYWKYIFQTLEAIFPYKGVFFTKVVKANIIAFIKTKILGPVLSRHEICQKNYTTGFLGKKNLHPKTA